MVQDVFHGRMPFTGRCQLNGSMNSAGANTFTWAFSHEEYNNDFHALKDAVCWYLCEWNPLSKSTKLKSSKTLPLAFFSFSPNPVCLVCWKMGIHRIETDKSKDGPFTIAVGDDWKFSDRSAERWRQEAMSFCWKFFSAEPGNTHWTTWDMWGNNDDSLMFRVFSKACKKNSSWLNSWLFQVLLMILGDQPHHIFVFRPNSNFCGFIDDPLAPKFHIISYVNHDQEWKSWWKMVGWDEPCPYPRSAQVAISGSFDVKWPSWSCFFLRRKHH